MKRFVCIHGHFYQPPRENPWLEEVEVQDSARPYHDWNERIAAECYAPNAASRILDRENRIIDIVDNYTQISFDMGPTLLSWLERKNLGLYQNILAADRKSRERFSGHGAAIAQAYNHTILPLAESRDKRTQILWGIADFKSRFGREPEGMWLPETAADLESLDIMAEQELRFTILAPHQARRVRRLDQDEWQDVTGGKIDPTQPYFCRLPSGRSISIFFYDGSISGDIAFGDALKNGDALARRIQQGFSENHEKPQLVHVATDGETYGHHHRFGEMALSYCLYDIKSSGSAQITVYAEYLERFPPRLEVEIYEKTSWSCPHGVERWRHDCGCSSGAYPKWRQKWRKPLRQAMDDLNSRLTPIFEEGLRRFQIEAWEVRNAYIQLMRDRSQDNLDGFFRRFGLDTLAIEERTGFLKLLEMQRAAQLMFTSCGWFFDEISGIETVQNMQHAARAMQLARETRGIDLEPEFLKILENAPSNRPWYRSGADVYARRVKPAILNLSRIAVHYAISSLFEDIPDIWGLGSYSAQPLDFAGTEAGHHHLALGRVRLRSEATRETEEFTFGVLHFGDHNLIAGMVRVKDRAVFKRLQPEIESVFSRGDTAAVIRLMDTHLGSHDFSLQDLFKDRKRQVLDRLLAESLQEFQASLRSWLDNHHPLMQAAQRMAIPLPGFIGEAIESLLISDLKELLSRSRLDLAAIRDTLARITNWTQEQDRELLSFIIGQRIAELLGGLVEHPQSLPLLREIVDFIELIQDLPLDIDHWRSQNHYFCLIKEHAGDMENRAQAGDAEAEIWIRSMRRVGRFLNVKYD